MKTYRTPLILCLALGSIFYACGNRQEPLVQPATHADSATPGDKTAANKKLVLDFYQKMFGDKDLTAVDQYIAPGYIQHNPTVADGAAAFKKAAAEWFKGAPKTTIDVQHAAAEGDLVFLHLKNKKPDGRITSTVDIFRLEHGKIVEHWDVHQDVPEKAANPHPMF
ncbi:ester cyclase [Niabella beijingensis]|uniref:nuclear transport factor 2 family protein n=1 Tax=Niabella beijingensis TaxID=2872700 RepID=UPI001CBCC64F|nr:ester cyclase [Niabella beijingensis]MBZ4191868.1 ester cyclase [Niabella beijingensis]